MKLRSSIFKLFLFALLYLVTGSQDLLATHYRYGNLTWSKDVANPLKIHFKLTESWRRGFPWNGYDPTNPVPPNVGSIIKFNSNFPLNFGDGFTANVVLTVTSISAADDWIYGEFNVDHTFATPGNFIAFMEGAARFSGPSNGGALQNNGDLSFRIESRVTVGNNNDAPVGTLPPFINMVIGNSAALYQIPASDPNGDALTYTLAPSASFTQTGVTPVCTQPLGLTVSPSGLITFNTTNAFYSPTVMAVGKYFNAIIRVADTKGAYTHLDVLIKITNASNAPLYDYTVTPANNFVYTIEPGQPLSYTVKAKDPDVADNVTLFVSGLPVGASTSPSLPFSGGVNLPVQTTFNWTPTTAQVGSYVTLYTAQDPQGVQTPTTVKITVACNTAFTTSKEDVVCGNPGSITLTVTDGTGPFQFSKNGGMNYFNGTSPYTFSGLSAGSYNVSVKEANGCVAGATINVNVNPGLAPTIICPMNITVNTSSTGCTAKVCYPSPAVTDDCPPATPAGYNKIAEYGNSYYYQSNSLKNYSTAQNNAVASGGHLAVITSEDENNAISGGGGGFSWIGGNDIVSDGNWVWSDCSLYSYSNFCVGEPNGGTFENHLEFESGGCWNDLNSAALRYAIIEIEGTKLMQTAGLAQNAEFPLGVTTNKFEATDIDGNKSSCSMTVEVIDNTPPTFTRPDDIIIYRDASCDFDRSVSNTGDVNDESDNCSVGQATFIDEINENDPCAVTIIRTWSLVDANGNAADNQLQFIFVKDNTIPTFTRPADKTIYRDAECTYNASPSNAGDVLNEEDNCGVGQAIYSDVINDDDPCVRIITRTWSLTDNCGNEATDQVQIITVKDNTSPTFTRPADKTIYRDENCSYDADISITGDVINEADNCGVGQSTYNDEINNDDPCEVIITRTWSLTDNCGNEATDQVQIITVKDNTPPTFARPADKTIYRDASCGYNAGITITGDVNNEADNCGVGSAMYSDDINTEDPCEVIITRTWSLKDNCNNAAEDQIQIITVKDNTLPTFTRPADMTINRDAMCAYNANPSNTGDVTNEADNCGVDQSTYNDVINSSNPCKLIITRTWSLTDNCGNSAANQVQTITVIDNTAPTFTKPADITINRDAMCAYNANPSNTGDVTNEADNCGVGQATYMDNFGSGDDCKDVIIRTWSLTDNCGNAAADQVQIITIKDNTPPTFTRPADISIPFNSSCGYDASVSMTGDVTNEADNCSTGLQATATDMVTQCGSSYVIKRTWHLTDNCNNAAVDQIQTITVSDNNTNYIIYATKEAKFGEYNTIQGDVGVSDVKGKAEFNKYCVLDPNKVIAKEVVVKTPSNVNNVILTPATGGPNPAFLPYNGTGGTSDLTISSNGTYSGNYKKLTVKPGIIATLTGNDFGDIHIEEGAKVTFTSSVINIVELELKKGKKGVNLTYLNFSGCTAVKIGKKVSIEEDSRINVDGPKVIFYVGDNLNDEEKFTIKGDNAWVSANIMIPKGKLQIHGGVDYCIMAGWFIVEKLNSDGKNVLWTKYSCNNNQTISTADYNSNPKGDELKTQQAVVMDGFEVKASPNPTVNEFNIEINSNSNETIVINILNASGVLKSTYQQSGKGILNTRIGKELSAGVYFAEIKQGQFRKLVKLIKFD